MLHFLNNSLLIVHGISTTMVVKEASPLKPLSILKALVVFKHHWLIHTQEKTKNAIIDRDLLLDMFDSEATTSPREMKTRWLKDCTMPVLFQFHLRWQMSFKTITVAFMKKMTVEQLLKMLITLFWQLDMVFKVVFLIGMSKIHGELNGEFKDTLRLSEEKTCVQWLNATHIHSLINQKDWLKLKKFN